MPRRRSTGTALAEAREAKPSNGRAPEFIDALNSATIVNVSIDDIKLDDTNFKYRPAVD